MEQAINDLSYDQSIHFTIRTTHLYLRFAPRTEAEYDALTDDSALVLYNHPLDHEISGSDGGSYHDPSLPADQPTYQYAVVRAPYSAATAVPYQVLSSLYIPEEDTQLDATNPDIQEAINDLVTAAEVRSGNDSVPPKFEPPYNPPTTEPVIVPNPPVLPPEPDFYESASATSSAPATTSAASYHPQGRMRVFDTHLNQLIGLAGVKVRARRWFTTSSGITDENGNYFVGRSFSRPVNYSIFYERDDFDIRSDRFGQAYLNGPKQT